MDRMWRSSWAIFFRWLLILRLGFDVWKLKRYHIQRPLSTWFDCRFENSWIWRSSWTTFFWLTDDIQNRILKPKKTKIVICKDHWCPFLTLYSKSAKRDHHHDLFRLADYGTLKPSLRPWRGLMTLKILPYAQNDAIKQSTKIGTEEVPHGFTRAKKRQFWDTATQQKSWNSEIRHI